MYQRTEADCGQMDLWSSDRIESNHIIILHTYNNNTYIIMQFTTTLDTKSSLDFICFFRRFDKQFYKILSKIITLIFSALQ